MNYFLGFIQSLAFDAIVLFCSGVAIFALLLIVNKFSNRPVDEVANETRT